VEATGSFLQDDGAITVAVAVKECVRAKGQSEKEYRIQGLPCERIEEDVSQARRFGESNPYSRSFNKLRGSRGGVIRINISNRVIGCAIMSTCVIACLSLSRV